MSEQRRLEDIATLGRGPLLTGLPIEDIGALLGLLEIVEAPAGAVVAREGDGSGGLCFVLEGDARASRHGVEVGRLAPGDGFGGATLASGGVQEATVTALAELRLARLTREAFDALGTTRPSTALHLAMTLLAHLGRETVSTEITPAAERRRTRHPEVVARLPDADSTLPTGTHVADVVPKEIDGAMVVGALLDHLAVPLDASIVADATVTPLTTSTWEGREIHRRTAGLALLEAARRIDAGPIVLGPSITSGRIVSAPPEADRPTLARALGQALAAVVSEHLPVREEQWSVDEAAAHFDEQGWTEASALVAAWHEPRVAVVSCGEVVALSQGPTLPTTGMLAGLEVLPHPDGLLLDYGPAIRRFLGPKPTSTRVLEMTVPRYGTEKTRYERQWLELLGATSVGRFNQACVSGRVQEIIHVSEGFHEKRISLIADTIAAKNGIRIVAISGPSSSGKTTFIKRLKIQLQVNGIHPLELSLDDYYVDRHRSPLDANGDYDFEAVEALDLALLDQHVERLLAGETVRTARYDFLAGLSDPSGGRELTVGPADVLLVEGIHALNPMLLGQAAEHQAFRIFVHPTTALPFDRLTLFEPADVRLLRRIVRDRHQRGYGAAENLARWPSVRRGERVHIFPFLGNADAIFDSSLVYELSVLRVYAERYLREVPRSHAEFSAAHRLRRLLGPFVPIHPDNVPPTSMLREFIGGSGFTY